MHGCSVAQGRFSSCNLNYIYNLNSTIPLVHHNSLYFYSQLNSVGSNKQRPQKASIFVLFLLLLSHIVLYKSQT